MSPISFKIKRRLVQVLVIAACLSVLSLWLHLRQQGRSGLRVMDMSTVIAGGIQDRATRANLQEPCPSEESDQTNRLVRYMKTGNDQDPIPSSQFLNGVAGYSLFENLYLRNGTFYFVEGETDSQGAPLPLIKHIISAPPNDMGERLPPGDEDFQVIPSERVEEVLGSFVIRLEGASVLLNDQRHPKSSSFMGHYFHFVVETFLGAWRLLSANFALTKGQGTTQGMDTPRRIMFRTAPDDWRDRAGLTPWFINNIMPGSVVEDMFVWQDRAKSEATFLFEQITISDRFAAHRFGGRNALWNKMSAEVVHMDAPEDWIDPLRQNIRRVGALHGCLLERKTNGVPIVTYVNRQKTSRRLNETDAEGLVEKMQALHERGVIEFYNAQMEDLQRVDQFCLASKTDILVGVHGNGLSHQLWMQPGSWVIEIMDVGGFAMDYALPAQLMRHNYRAIHNDTIFEENLWITPEGKGVKQSKLFHGKNIRVDPTFIQELIQDIVRGGLY